MYPAGRVLFPLYLPEEQQECVECDVLCVCSSRFAEFFSIIVSKGNNAGLFHCMFAYINASTCVLHIPPALLY